MPSDPGDAGSVPDAPPGPETTITEPQAGATTTATVTVEFAAPGTGIHFACRLDGEAASACSSPRVYTNLASGVHTVFVRAIRNPLGALKMATDLLPADQPLPPEPRMRQLVARIGQQIGRLERMVYDFLDASRIESGHLELKAEDCDVRELVRITLDLFEPAAVTHRLVVSVPDEPIRVQCDPMRVEQVLANLVNNAIKYSPPGGAVRVAIARRPDAVEITVADEGVGMAADEIEHVFDPFRRGTRARHGVPGAGLGLFVARRIVEAHGGEIAVDSAPGAGSTFTVHLPGRLPPPDVRGS